MIKRQGLDKGGDFVHISKNLLGFDQDDGWGTSGRRRRKVLNNNNLNVHSDSSIKWDRGHLGRIPKYDRDRIKKNEKTIGKIKESPNIKGK